MTKNLIIFFYISSLILDIKSQDYIINHVSNHNQNHFGWSIASDNDYVAVSDPRDSINFYANGCINIYKKFGYEWEFMQKLQNPTLNPYDYFGHRTSMTNNFLAVSSNGDREKGFMAGAVHIFYHENGTWKFLQTLRQTIAEEKTQFGEAVLLTGQYLFVGAPGCSGNGSVFVYTLSGDTFSLMQKIDNPYPLRLQFGKSMAHSGDLLLVGAPSANMAMYKGVVFIFKRNGSSWELNKDQEELFPDDNDYGSLFGFTISAEKDKLLIGAPHANVLNSANEEIIFAGKVYYYTCVNGTYVKQMELVNPDLDSHDLFGSDVIVSDSLIYITSPKDDVNENDEGNIYIYWYTEGEWVHRSLNNKEANANQYFGNNFYVDNFRLFVSSAGSKANKNKGMLYTYDVRDILELEKEEKVKQTIDLFPNPADDKFRIAISENVSYTLRIYSNDGKVHIVNDLKGNSEIDISNFTNGSYLVSINTKKQSFTESLMIMHKR